MIQYLKLGSLTRIRTGKLDANAANDGGIYPFFTCSREPLSINTYSYNCECVLVAGNGDLNVKYYDGKFDAYQRTYIIESLDKTKLMVKYLYCFLDLYVETLRQQAIGGVIKYIKLGNLTDAIIPIPTIEKQREIVDIFENCNGTIAYRQQELELMDQLVKSRFIEMFGDPNNNPMGWNKARLSECLTSIDNGKSFVCDSEPRIEERPAVLKLSAATYGYYQPMENKAMLDDSQFIKSAEVHKGDLLFTRKNTPELVGMSAFVYETPPNLMMPDLIFRLNTRANCNKMFLWKIINLDLFRANVTALSSGSAKSMSNISKERLLGLEIILPPIELQNDFATFVEQVDKSKFYIVQTQIRIQLLIRAIQYKSKEVLL